uniref:N-acetyltransferase domain-containing protein n=1 Tax=viral metagenome TaxID=1070528 RepID=A0A6C0EWV2_9ZZZZ
MEIVTQIKQICVETDNEWFLSHNFPKIALCDLQLKKKLEKENIFTFNERECICQTNTGEHCIRCEIEMERSEEIDKLNLPKHYDYIYDYNTNYYTKSVWIIPDKIEDEIPGFILIKCCGDGIGESEGFTHTLEFACVRHKYRKKGILKNMVNRIPKEWNIWLEANSNDIENVENIWEKCGFVYHKTIHGHLIYKKSAL